MTMASTFDQILRQMGLPANWSGLFEGGAEATQLDLQKLFAAQALQQQQQQQALQPLRMALIKGQAQQVGQPGFNPYATAPKALPNLPGIEGGGTVGSTPGQGPGLGMPDFSGLRQQLLAAFPSGGGGSGMGAGGGGTGGGKTGGKEGKGKGDGGRKDDDYLR